MEGYPGMVYGLKLLTNSLLTEKKLKRMCRSKRKRIIKKWLKNPKNYKIVPEAKVYLIRGNSIICHPEIAQSIIKACEEKVGSINLSLKEVV